MDSVVTLLLLPLALFALIGTHVDDSEEIIDVSKIFDAEEELKLVSLLEIADEDDEDARRDDELGELDERELAELDVGTTRIGVKMD